MATANNIIVGGARVFVAGAMANSGSTGASGGYVNSATHFQGVTGAAPAPLATKSIYDSPDTTRGLIHWANSFATPVANEVGYTTDGIDLEVAPEFSDVQVDQLLDTAVMFKTAQKVSFKTSFAEATLVNLARAIGRSYTEVTQTGATGALGTTATLGLAGGSLGEFPSERRIIAVANGPRSGAAGTKAERVFEAYRAISVESVGVAVKRNEVTAFPVSFRCLPTDDGVYMKIADRVYG